MNKLCSLGGAAIDKNIGSDRPVIAGGQQGIGRNDKGGL